MKPQKTEVEVDPKAIAKEKIKAKLLYGSHLYKLADKDKYEDLLEHFTPESETYREIESVCR